MIQSVGYIRVSTTMQDFERQRDEINEYARRNDFVITKFFEDKHTGSDYEGRKGFQCLMDYLEEYPEIKVIIFDEISRMGRDTAEQVITYKKLSLKGIRIYTRGKGEFGRNKEDNLLFTVLSAISEYEKQTIIDRTSSGRRRVVREGATQISKKPYGYNILLTQKKDRQVIKRQFVEINKKEASVVKKIFTMIDGRSSITDIIRYLKKNIINSPTGNKIWGSSTIVRILHNTMYYGKWQFGKYYKNHKTEYSLSKRNEDEFIIVDIPAIIEKELFDRVQIKIKEKRDRFNPKNQKQIYLLKGLLICHCNRYIQSSSDTRSKGRTHRCPQRNLREIVQKTCHIRSVNCDFLEKIFIFELKKKILDNDYFQKLKLEKLKNYQSPILGLQEQIDCLNQNILTGNQLLKSYYEKAAKYELENQEKANIFESLADSKLEEIKQKKTEISALQREMNGLQENNIDMSVFQNIKKGLEFITKKELEELSRSNQQSKQGFLRKYVKEVRLRYLEDETSRLRASIQQLRKKGIFKKNNVHLKKLYLTCFTKEHQLKQCAIQVLALYVKFVNNLVIEIKFPYFHKSPDMAYNYILNNKKIEFVPSQ